MPKTARKVTARPKLLSVLVKLPPDMVDDIDAVRIEAGRSRPDGKRPTRDEVIRDAVDLYMGNDKEEVCGE